MNIFSPLLGGRKNNLIFDLPIAQRLTLGFLTAALIATVVATGIGIQRTQSMYKLSDFYQNLLQTKTTLTMGASYLNLMDSEIHVTLGLVAAPIHSQETLHNNQNTLQKLAGYYSTVLKEYIAHYLLENHPDQIALLNEADHASQVTQQRVLIGSAWRSWTNYHEAQEQVMQDLSKGDVVLAGNLTRLLAEPIYADAQSALRALMAFDTSLANSISDSVKVEQRDQFLITIIGAISAFLAIVLVGLFISSGVVYRLKHMRQVTEAMKEGKLHERVKVIGNDEIADISGSINAMLEIIAAEKEAGTAGELRDQFIASVSHELRNPLSEVYGWLELLRDYQGQLDAPTQTKFLNNAAYGCQELMHLINNVLDSTQIGHQMKSPQLEEIRVASIVQRVMEQLDPRETQEYSFAMEVPEHLVAWADQQYIRQILRNLLTNALKYSPQHTLITVSARQMKNTGDLEEAQICISVQDAGPGIPPDEIPNLFQKFKRLKRDIRGTARGTGLGLYISKQLVEAMHGHIWVESSGIPGEGSCFYFTLPKVSSLAPSRHVDTYLYLRPHLLHLQDTSILICP